VRIWRNLYRGLMKCPNCTYVTSVLQQPKKAR
jgi:hypothetical protein